MIIVLIVNLFYLISKKNVIQILDNITPTVELNALAMKRGEQTTYTIIETPQYVPTPAPLYNNFRPDLYSHARSGPFNNFTNVGYVLPYF